MMNFESFKTSLLGDEPPPSLAPALRAMWYEAKGDWHQAHEIVQAENDGDGAWVHAYLHRKEGDASNANYWYRRAEQPFPKLTSEAEWESLVTSLLSRRLTE